MLSWVDLGGFGTLSTDEPATVRAVLLGAAYDAPVGLDVLELDDEGAAPWSVVAFIAPTDGERLYHFGLVQDHAHTADAVRSLYSL